MANGTQKTYEQLTLGMFLEPTCGASDLHARISASQDSGQDWGGERSSLVREVFRIIGEISEGDRPEWLIYENVKGMFSSNKGRDYLAVLSEMDELGYDAQWQLFNSKDWGVPQNRERVYTIGHLRTKGRQEILPLSPADGENSLAIDQVGKMASTRNNPNAYRVYEKDGLSPCLNTMDGGGREPHIVEKEFP